MNYVVPFSRFTDFDINLFKAGKHFRLYQKFGVHKAKVNGEDGLYFSVWAPSAKKVFLIGDFNYWNSEEYPLNVRWDESGIWEGFVPGLEMGVQYKYKIHSHQGVITEKSDPFSFFYEHPPSTSSIAYDIEGYDWKDQSWMSYRSDKNGLDKPYAVLEVHLASWKHTEENRPLTYMELATDLVAYLKEMEYTHVEFMPVMEYPYDPSWGYQIVGYYAPTSRFGSPKEFMYLIDKLHQNDIGVILDWVPSHFPDDAHGLGLFDGSHLYEHPDWRKGYHPDWKSLIFNYERNEVRAFLISNASYWLDKYHIDGLRVDAVASMLYLDYSREDDGWEPNVFGGRENLAAISFLKEFNKEVYTSFDGIQTIAEESTAFPMVTKPESLGGLGFGMKWMMGWMNDVLEYFKEDCIYRKYHHNKVTFSLAYAFTENYILPLSHDEVVYGKQSLLSKMPGDLWQRMANLRLLYGFMYTHPGTNLTFMGSEFGQHDQWDFSKSLDWHLLEFEPHQKMQAFVKALNHFYKNQPALYEKAFSEEGFEWIDYNNYEDSVISYIRKGHDSKNDVVVVCNFTPVVREDFLMGVHQSGYLTEVLNSDNDAFGGSGLSNTRPIKISKKPWNFKSNSVRLTIPPLAILLFKITKKV